MAVRLINLWTWGCVRGREQGSMLCPYSFQFYRKTKEPGFRKHEVTPTDMLDKVDNRTKWAGSLYYWSMKWKLRCDTTDERMVTTHAIVLICHSIEIRLGEIGKSVHKVCRLIASEGRTLLYHKRTPANEHKVYGWQGNTHTHTYTNTNVQWQS